MAGSMWMRCSACRRDIAFGAVHWVCSVSTCNRNRTRLVFCSVACWDSHVAMLRHPDEWAAEQARDAGGDDDEREVRPPAPTPAPRRVAVEPPRAAPSAPALTEA